MADLDQKLNTIRGMNDLLPDTLVHWHHLESILRQLANSYGYRELRTPMLERTELFKRSLGEQTDIVEKEMYTFKDIGGDSLTLRPEATASCVRSGIQHNLFNPQQSARLWYYGPMFRHERPQKGRYRQFYQYGMEAFGWDGPDIDAELILFGARLWERLGLKDIILEINSLGSMQARSDYRIKLVEYFSERKSELDEDSTRRLELNPLRILDSKNPDMQSLVADAPNLQDHLDEESEQHFLQLREYLDSAGVSYKVNARLVRGLDYYNRTVFEWTTDKLGSQSAVCAGGRYDSLVEQLGGKSVTAAGFAMGIERLIELMSLEQSGSGQVTPDVYMVLSGREASVRGIVLAEELRKSGLKIITHCGGGSIKSQMRRANQSHAAVAVILGESELAESKASVKWLRSEQQQQSIPVDMLAKKLLDRLD